MDDLSTKNALSCQQAEATICLNRFLDYFSFKSMIHTMRNKAAWYLLAVFLLSYLPSDAQLLSSLSRYPKNDGKDNKIKMQLHKRVYLGVYGWHIMSNPYTMRVRDSIFYDGYDFRDKKNGKELDTTFTTTARLTKSLSGYLGVSVPVAMSGSKSMFCLDIEANILTGGLTYDTVILPLTYKNLKIAETIPFMMASLPVSFNYKFGGDATLSKDNRTLLSAGAGIATSYITIDDNTNSEALIKAVPFIKAEVGFVFGVAFKLRGTAYLGNYEMTNYTSPEASTAVGVLSRQYSGQLGYNFSVIIMPMALAWDKPLVR